MGVFTPVWPGAGPQSGATPGLWVCITAGVSRATSWPGVADNAHLLCTGGGVGFCESPGVDIPTLETNTPFCLQHVRVLIWSGGHWGIAGAIASRWIVRCCSWISGCRQRVLCKHLQVISRRSIIRTWPEARLAQPAERKALNLVVVGSSPTVGVFIPCVAGGRSAERSDTWLVAAHKADVSPVMS